MQKIAIVNPEEKKTATWKKSLAVLSPRGLAGKLCGTVMRTLEQKTAVSGPSLSE
jgi:hypothetical protein